jgi:hypothetical protein
MMALRDMIGPDQTRKSMQDLDEDAPPAPPPLRLTQSTRYNVALI